MLIVSNCGSQPMQISTAPSNILYLSSYLHCLYCHLCLEFHPHASLELLFSRFVSLPPPGIEFPLRQVCNFKTKPEMVYVVSDSLLVKLHLLPHLVHSSQPTVSCYPGDSRWLSNGTTHLPVLCF